MRQLLSLSRSPVEFYAAPRGALFTRRIILQTDAPLIVGAYVQAVATVDRTVLMSLSRTTGEAGAASLVEAVLSDIPRLLDGVEAADPSTLADAAHSLASAASIVGATELVTKATALEDAARSGEPVDVRSATADLRRTAELTMADVRQMILDDPDPQPAEDATPNPAPPVPGCRG